MAKLFKHLLSPKDREYIKMAHKDGPIGKGLNFVAKEAYNLLRTNVAFSFPHLEGKCKVVGIASAVPNEGKSYTSINLAAAYVADGKKTLLINGDMRNPSYARVFNQKENPGLSNLFLNSSIDVVRQSDLVPGLDIIFSGAIPPNPSELIGSDEFKKILDNFRKIYDFIILDLPPVNVVSDALAASKVVDGILLVTRHNLSNKKEIVNAVNQLKFVKANVIGFVYNDFSFSGSSYSYRHSYSKKYKYGYGYGQQSESVSTEVEPSKEAK